MTTFDKTAERAGVKAKAVAQGGKWDPIWGRLDLMAILTSLLGAVLLGVAAVAIAVMELAKLIAGLWSDPFGCWLLLGFGLAVAWVAARWKRLCVF